MGDVGWGIGPSKFWALKNVGLATPLIKTIMHVNEINSN